jgi:hypothetical protein
MRRERKRKKIESWNWWSDESIGAYYRYVVQNLLPKGCKLKQRGTGPQKVPLFSKYNTKRDLKMEWKTLRPLMSDESVDAEWRTEA